MKRFAGIKYDDEKGEEFRGQDLLEVVFSIEEIEQQLNSYHNDIIKLYEAIKTSFDGNIDQSPSISNTEFKNETVNINQPALIPYLEDVQDLLENK